MSGGKDSLATLVAQRRIFVCAGSGGVGKTTTAAAVALEAARRGRRACVVTIDPARRLGDALGIAELTNDPKQVEGEWTGELWALMLDTKSTFDHVVGTNASSPQQAEAIYNNRFYRNISAALSGTQEYMAMEKLHQLYSEDRFDLVVVDTPPTRHALDFLHAPARLTRLLDNRIFRLLMRPTRAGLRAVNVATQLFLRTISKVVGSEVVTDAVAFFEAFEGMEQGFRDRAQEVLVLLSAEVTGWVLVTTPRREAVDEALYFAERLEESKISVDAVVVNRMYPVFAPVALPDGADVPGPLQALVRNLDDLSRVAAAEEAQVAVLTDRVRAPVVRVPYLETDVHDIEGLGEVGQALFGDAPGGS
jgi:anion-transporting  ArsA/GET3 family ATPase